MARKEKNIHYIYKTTCVITGRWYVGMHSCYDINDGYMGSGVVLRRSIRKYGVENHVKEILEFLPTRETLILREREIVNKELIGDGKCMNLKEGGEGGITNEEHKISFSKGGNKAKGLKLKNDLEYRKNFGIKSYENLKQHLLSGNHNFKTFEGKNHSEETKKIMSEKAKLRVGEQNSQYGTCWITRDGVNKKIKIS